MELLFEEAKKSGDIENIYNYNIDVFSDSPDFEWSLNSIQREIKEGWNLFAVKSEEDVVAAVFYQINDDSLMTKSTAIKMAYQGSGCSHQIKEFFEMVARDKKLKKIYHFCSIDNFRMYSLNESHGYEKTNRKLGDSGQVVEWIKKI